MKIVDIASVAAPEVAVYATLTEAQLRQSVEAASGVFIAESPKVIRVAMSTGMQPLSLLCERRHIGGDAAAIIAEADACRRRCGMDELTVYTADRATLCSLTGYTLTRGVLAAMARPALPTVESICAGARRVAVIEGVTDTTNIGAIFRSAAALGMDGVLLTRDSCDPLNRRAVRVSMGTVMLVPWTWIDTYTAAGGSDGRSGDAGSRRLHYTARLHALGFCTMAMALRDDAISLGDPVLRREERVAIILGTEGDGLPHSTIAAADRVVRIPMAHGVDSLNVAAASAVAFWELAANR